MREETALFYFLFFACFRQNTLWAVLLKFLKVQIQKMVHKCFVIQKLAELHKLYAN